MSSRSLLRDIIPRDRLCIGLIGDVLVQHRQLGRWSREENDAIRPRRLAHVLRTNLWLGLDPAVADMRKGLEKAPAGAVDYNYTVTIRRHPDSPPDVLAARARFTRRWSGRIVVEIALEGRPVTRCPFLLPRWS